MYRGGGGVIILILAAASGWITKDADQRGQVEGFKGAFGGRHTTDHTHHSLDLVLNIVGVSYSLTFPSV